MRPKSSDIITEIEYTKERSAKELFEFFSQKEEERCAWSWEHSETKAIREIKYRELDKGLPKKFAHEFTPFAYYANTYYSNKPEVRFKPCCGSELYDGIIIDNGNEIFVEITNAIDGKIWGLQKELLTENGHSPWEHSIHGVKGNKTKRNRSPSDIIISNEAIRHSDVIRKSKISVKNVVLKKCIKSLGQTLPYGREKTILIVTFDDTAVRPSRSKKDWDDFVDFKRTEIDSMEHNFRKIILFGWLDKKFIS
jgi:hypothetical protein